MTILAIYNDTERRLEIIDNENILDEYETELSYKGYAVFEFSNMQKIFDANATKTLGMGEYKLNDLINFARENNLL